MPVPDGKRDEGNTRMGFWKALFGRLSANTPEVATDPADNPFSDEDDFSARERTPLPPRPLRQREEDPDTLAGMRRDSGEEPEEDSRPDEDARDQRDSPRDSEEQS